MKKEDFIERWVIYPHYFTLRNEDRGKVEYWSYNHDTLSKTISYKSQHEADNIVREMMKQVKKDLKANTEMVIKAFNQYLI